MFGRKRKPSSEEGEKYAGRWLKCAGPAKESEEPDEEPAEKKVKQKPDWTEIFNIRITPRENIYLSLIIGRGDGLAIFCNLRRGRYEYKASQGIILGKDELVHLNEHLRAFHSTPTYTGKSIKVNAYPRQGQYEFERFKHGEKQGVLKMPLAAVAWFKQLIPLVVFYIETVLKFECADSHANGDEMAAADKAAIDFREHFMFLCGVTVARYIARNSHPGLPLHEIKCDEHDRDMFWDLYCKLAAYYNHPVFVEPVKPEEITAMLGESLTKSEEEDINMITQLVKKIVIPSCPV